MQRGRLVLEGVVDDLKAGRKIVEGILPSDDFAINGFASDARIGRLDRNGRILRAYVTEQPEAIAEQMNALGAQGLRVVDLSLEDIFLDAVAPKAVTASIVEGV